MHFTGHYKKLQCEFCGETDITKFRKHSRSTCKKCENEKSKQRYRNFDISEKEIIKKRGRDRYKNMSINQKKKYIEKQKNWATKNLIKFRVMSAKHRAKRINKEFSITTEIMIEKYEKQNHKCYISNLPLSMDINSPYVISIDRLDSSIGYTPDNSILVTKFVNISKNDLSLNDFIKYIKEVCDNI